MKRLLSLQVNNKDLRILLVPLLIIIIGIACNLIVVNLNNGMPILDSDGVIAGSPYAINQNYVDITSNTKLIILSDIFPMGNYTFSIGDFLMIFGYLYFTIMLSKIFIRTLRKHEAYN